MNKTILELSKCVNLVTSVAIEKDGKFLFVAEAKASIRGLFNFPSGKVHLGENLIEAAKREALEETGYEIEITDLISIYHYSWDDGPGITIRFNFLGRLKKSTQESLADDVLSISWKTRSEMRNLIKENRVRFAGTARMIKEVLSNKKCSLDHLLTSSDPLDF